MNTYTKERVEQEKFTTNKPKTRDTNIDLLRIIAMLMVITIHCLGNGNLLGNSKIPTYNLVGIRILDTLSLVAVPTFFIISGYYMSSYKINLKKIFLLYGRVVFYSLLLYFIGTLINIKTNKFSAFFPISSGSYWFVNAYFILYMFSPILNMWLNILSKKQFKFMLILWIFLLSIVRMTINPNELLSAKILPVFMMYSIGFYMKKFVSIKKDKYYIIKYLILTFILIYCYTLTTKFNKIFIYDDNLHPIFYRLLTNFREFYNLIVIAMTVLLFMKFKTIKINSKFLTKLITIISPSVFSIYLIHYNFNFRFIIWEKFNAIKYADSWFMILYIVFIIFAVFILCLIIDLVRNGLYKLITHISLIKRFIMFINKKIDNLNLKINNYIS